jgi:hypothetical protein
MISLAVVFVALGDCGLPGVRWVVPGGNSWRGLDFSTLISLRCEVEWEEVSLGPGAILEYQMDTLEDSAPWHRFANGPDKGRVEAGIRRVSNEIEFDGGGVRPRFIRVRLNRAGQSGRSSSAFFLGGDEELSAPSVRYVGRGERRVRSSGPGEADLVFPLEIAGHEGANRVEYRWRRSGQAESAWRHGGDFGPGRKEVHVSGLDFPVDAKPGERMVVEFRTFNGDSYSRELTSAEIAVNRPPSVTRATTEESSLGPEAGKPFVLPFSVSDEDGDAVTLLYRIGDDVSWSAAATTSGEAVLPADVVSRLLSMPDEHKVEVAAFDGLELSPFPEWYEDLPSVAVGGCPAKPADGLQEISSDVLGSGFVQLWHAEGCSTFILKFTRSTNLTLSYKLDNYHVSLVTEVPFKGMCFRVYLPDSVARGLKGYHDISFFVLDNVQRSGVRTKTYNFWAEGLRRC